MRRLVIACVVSVFAYAAVFGWVVDRPLAYGFLEEQIDAKLKRGAVLQRPKLVILAGSNGPYSHRCEIIEPIVGIPCVNGGVAVGIGLDYLFARWKKLLHRGDVVYLPMEEAQYGRTKAGTAVGPDAAIMFRHDWGTLSELPLNRWLGALFSFDLRFAVMALIEHGLLAGGFHDPREEATGRTNAWGDHVGHVAALGDPEGAAARPAHLRAAEVREGFAANVIAGFVRWGEAQGVRIIGGWSAEPEDSPMPEAARAALRAVYLANGGDFLELPNRSLYPRAARAKPPT